VFGAHGDDEFESRRWDVCQTGCVKLRLCHNCHQGIGATSFTSYSRVQAANDHFFILLRTSAEAQETAAAIKFLQTRDTWKRLIRLLH
jgi:hypothetical protein